MRAQKSSALLLIAVGDQVGVRHRLRFAQHSQGELAADRRPHFEASAAAASGTLTSAKLSTGRRG